MPPISGGPGMIYRLVILAILAAGNAMAEGKKDWIGNHLCREVFNYETSPTTRAALDEFVAAVVIVKTTGSITRTPDGGVSVHAQFPTADIIDEITRSSDFSMITGMVQKYCAESPDEKLGWAVPNVISEFSRRK
jgi:hypothetical protein